MALLTANVCMPFILGAFGTQFTSVVAQQSEAVNANAEDTPTSPSPASASDSSTSGAPTEGSSPADTPPSGDLESPTAALKAAVSGAVCRVWGPESSASAFSALMDKLERAGGMPAVQAVDHPISRTYLVYIDEFVAQSTILERQSTLQDQNIEYSLLRGDDGGFSLSVGVFSQSRRANKQLRLLNSLGFPGAIKEMVKYETRYNLTAHVEVETDLYKSSTSDCMAIAHTR